MFIQACKGFTVIYLCINCVKLLYDFVHCNSIGEPRLLLNNTSVYIAVQLKSGADYSQNDTAESWQSTFGIVASAAIATTALIT